MYSVPLSEGRKYSFCKTNMAALIKNTELFLSVCTDTVGQLCAAAVLRAIVFGRFVAARARLCVNILGCFMSRTVLDDIWCLTFFFVMQSFLRKEKKKKRKEEHKTLPGCLKYAKIAKLGKQREREREKKKKKKRLFPQVPRLMQ